MPGPSPIKKNGAVAQGGAQPKEKKQSVWKSWNTMCEEEGKGKK